VTLITAPQVAAALGVSISTLYRWRTQKLLVPGEDWYLKFPSARSPLRYSVEKVQRRIASLSARSAQELESVLGWGADGLAQYSGAQAMRMRSRMHWRWAFPAWCIHARGIEMGSSRR
jgi:hypothetical protein